MLLQVPGRVVFRLGLPLLLYCRCMDMPKPTGALPEEREAIPRGGPTREELAQMLGLSLRGVYRLLNAYEEVFGPLPRGLKGERVVDEEALRRLRRAVSLQALWDKAGVPSYKEVLVQVREEEGPDWAQRVRDLERGLAEMSRQMGQVHQTLGVLVFRTEEVAVLAALVRDLKEAVEQGLRELADVRLILYASLEDIARQEYGALLSQPSLLRNRKTAGTPGTGGTGGTPGVEAPRAPETPVSRVQETGAGQDKEGKEGQGKSKPWWMRERTLI